MLREVLSNSTSQTPALHRGYCIMIVIVGFIVVIGSVVGGFTWAGGNVLNLWHPSEVVTIGGAMLGAAIIMSPGKVLKDTVTGLLGTFKSAPFSKACYEQLFQVMYLLFKMARQEGVLVLESHVSDPHASPIFSKFPLIHHNHHALDFICGAIGPLIDGSVTPDRIAGMLEEEIHIMEDEHHGPISTVSKAADGLPGFGIVAAVLGIVITMGHIDGPVEEIGHMVGAALVGTFLGILASYGFLAPMAVKMEFNGHEEMAFFRTVATMISGFANDLSPKVAIEMARRKLGSGIRPTREYVEELLKKAESA